MKTDLFIKTCRKDLPWLKYCLISIEKYAEDFRRTVIVIEEKDRIYLETLLTDLKLKKVYEVRTTNMPHTDKDYPHGIGYQWQMAVKLSWTDYTDADVIIITDSDTIFTSTVNPDTWKSDGKWLWIRRTVADATDPNNGYPFGSAVEAFLGHEVKYDYMCCQCFALTREATIMFQQYMQTKYNMTPYEYLLSDNGISFSEFVTLGAFIDSEMYYSGYVFRHPSEWPNYKPFPTEQYWSWASEEDRNKTFKDIEKILNI